MNGPEVGETQALYCVCGKPEHEPNDECPGPEGDLSGCPYFRRYAGLPGADPEGVCFQMGECSAAEEPMCVTFRPLEGWNGERQFGRGQS